MIRHWLYKKLSTGARTSRILLYHRIADEIIDTWDLAVRPDVFERHLKWLKNNCHVISLNELVHDWKRKKLKKNSIAITFDDGYLDNYTNAIPLLKKYGLPATFFITDEHKSLWWDELEFYFLKSALLPPHFHIIINGEELNFDLSGETIMTEALKKKISEWKGMDIPTTKRAELFVAVWKRLKFVDSTERQKALSAIKHWSAINPAFPEIMSQDQIAEISANSLFEIGAHTQTHSALSTLTEEVQKEEMTGNKNYLEKLTANNIKFVSYPYGDYNALTLDLSEKIGFAAGFTTQAAPVGYSKRASQLGRYCVTNKNLFYILQNEKTTGKTF